MSELMTEHEAYAYARASLMLTDMENAFAEALDAIGNVPVPLDAYVGNVLSAMGDARFHVKAVTSRDAALRSVE